MSRTYPRWQYHATLPAKIIHGPDQEAEGWYDTPGLLKAALAAATPTDTADETGARDATTPAGLSRAARRRSVFKT